MGANADTWPINILVGTSAYRDTICPKIPQIGQIMTNISGPNNAFSRRHHKPFSYHLGLLTYYMLSIFVNSH